MQTVPGTNQSDTPVCQLTLTHALTWHMFDTSRNFQQGGLRAGSMWDIRKQPDWYFWPNQNFHVAAKHKLA
jgi:hypothetical protein